MSGNNHSIIAMNHTPVLVKEVIEILSPKKGKIYIDATLGDGGYTKAIIEECPEVKIIAIDQNEKSLERAKANLKNESKQISFIHDNFKNIKDIASQQGYQKIDGVVYDLGLASWQIDEGEAGISFQKETPLDMRLDDSSDNMTTASEVLTKFPIKRIAEILYKYGDVKGSWGIARRIDMFRNNTPILYTSDLLTILGTKEPKKLAPIFQALRIYVNQEFDNLERSLKDAIDLMESDGKIIVISYHSGEDRIVKNIMRDRKHIKDDIKIIVKKPISPSIMETTTNPRSRSARLRAIEKL